MSKESGSGKQEFGLIYSYIRFSTRNQKMGVSLARQKKAAEAFALENGRSIDTTLRMHDLGKSGFALDPDTGGLGVFLAAVRNGTVQRGSWLVVESLDRLSRGVPLRVMRLVEDLMAVDITVVTLEDPLNKGCPI
jgi:DNA invertase Pin-like site-specific DNA recombinase